MATVGRVSPVPVTVYTGTDENNLLLAGGGNPLPVVQSLPPPSEVLRVAFSGTTGSGAGATQRLHGGSSGTPTLQGVSSYAAIYVGFQYSSSVALNGCILRVRRRYLNADGTPYTTWTAWTEYTFNSSSIAATSVFLLQHRDNTTVPPADELEVEVVNVPGGSAINWQAVILGLRQ